MRDVVTGPLPRGEVSTAVSARVPAELTFDCPVCRARHISGALFQQVGIFAGVSVLPDRRGATLEPLPQRPPVPTAARGTADLVRGYLRLHGPATLAEAAGFLGTTQAALRPVWPDDLAEVTVAGRRVYLPPEDLAALRAAPEPTGLRLLPPMDPLLQGRDRELLVPDPERRSAVWRAIGNPGTVLRAGEVVGTWRPKLVGRRLDLAVTAFERLTDADRTALQAEAERVAAVRGAAQVRVSYPA
jgi:hypothetical protein